MKFFVFKGICATIVMASITAVSFSASAQSLTNQQRNAVRAAKNYLNVQGFSKGGLIDQLEYEGYSERDADIAVNTLNVDWNRNAARSAKNYLLIQGFSCKGLIEQLKYDQYSYSQAKNGASAAGACD